MMLKLPKLPDRTTTKIAFGATVKLKEELQAYAALYRDTYGEASSANELIPFMLEAFLKSDPAFMKAQKDGSLNMDSGKRPSRARLKTGTTSSPSLDQSTPQRKEA